MAHHQSHYYVHCSQRISVLFLFAFTAAGVVSCGGPKKSPRTSLIIMFSNWSLEISEGILRNQKIIIGFDFFYNQRLIYLPHFDYVTYSPAKTQQTPSVEKHAQPPRVVYCVL